MGIKIVLLWLATGTLAHGETMRCFNKFERKIKALDNVQVTMNGAPKEKAKNSPVQLKLISKDKKG